MEIKTECIVYGIEPGSTVNIFRNEVTIGYIFINTGNTVITINNFILYPGTTWKTVEAGFIDKTIYKANFTQTNSLYPTCGTNNSSLTAIIYSKV